MKLAPKPAAFILLLFLPAFVSPPAAVAKVTRYLTGSVRDVSPRLHGPALDLGGGGALVAASGL